MRPLPTRHLVLLLVAAAACAPIAGCGSKDTDTADAKVRVAAALAPVAEAARAVGGDSVEVVDLTPVGGQPHGLEPSAGALRSLKGAEVVFTVGPDFQPAVTEALAGLPATVVRVDLLGTGDLLPPPTPIAGLRGRVEGDNGASSDPHVWVSPKRFITIVEQVRDALSKADPARQAAYAARAEEYLITLRTLDGEFKAGLADCATSIVLTTHPAFGYLARDYGLTQAVTAGISRSTRSAPEALASTAKFVRGKGLSTVFFGGPVPSRIANSIEATTGAEVAVLNPVEGLTQDQLDQRQTYVSLMRENLRQLQAGLDCQPPDA